jgi:6-phosphogluconolactonase
VSFRVEIHPSESWTLAAADAVRASIPISGSVVLTGGSAAELVFPLLTAPKVDWRLISLYFSDERAVRPDEPASNFGLIERTLLSHVRPHAVHRIRGEEQSDDAARAYELLIAPAVELGFDLMLLGMGADGHIAALFPGSPALDATDRLCLPVQRPDGITGITLTPPAITRARRILLLVSGSSKAEAVRRAVAGDERPSSCPVRLLAEHPNARFVLDEAAASML